MNTTPPKPCRSGSALKHKQIYLSLSLISVKWPVSPSTSSSSYPFITTTSSLPHLGSTPTSPSSNLSSMPPLPLLSSSSSSRRFAPLLSQYLFCLLSSFPFLFPHLFSALFSFPPSRLLFHRPLLYFDNFTSASLLPFTSSSPFFFTYPSSLPLSSPLLLSSPGCLTAFINTH